MYLFPVASPQEAVTSRGSPRGEMDANPEEEAKEEASKEAGDLEQEFKSPWPLSTHTLKHILELLCDESVSLRRGGGRRLGLWLTTAAAWGCPLAQPPPEQLSSQQSLWLF